MTKKNDLKPVQGKPLDSIDDDKTEEVQLDSDADDKAKDSLKEDTTKATETDKDDAKDTKETAKEDSKAESKDKDSKNKDSKDKDTKSDDKKDAKDAKDTKTSETDKKEAKDDDDEQAPPKPKRPVDPVEALKNELKLAFPDADNKLITTVLVASQGNLELAFSALLYWFDPLQQVDIPTGPATAPAALATVAGGTAAGAKYPLLTEDEILARKLQKQFEEEDRRRRREGRRTRQGHPQQQQHDDDSPDEFEQIKETFNQGIEEAKTTINGWMLGLTKKFEELLGDQESPSQRQQGPLFGALGGLQAPNRRTHSRFDEDPEIIGDSHLPLIRMDNNDKDLPDLPRRKERAPAALAKKWEPLDANSDKFQVDSDDD